MNHHFRKLAGALAAGALATGLIMAGAASAQADTTPPSSTWAELFAPRVNVNGITLCADNPSGSTHDGQALQLWRCHGYASNGAPQRWWFTDVTSTGGIPGGFHYYQIMNAASGYCLGTPPGTLFFPDTSSGASLVQENCYTNGSSTDWILVPLDRSNPTSDFMLETLLAYPTSATWCVSASSWADTNGTRLVIKRCDNGDSRQYWNLG